MRYMASFAVLALLCAALVSTNYDAAAQGADRATESGGKVTFELKWDVGQTRYTRQVIVQAQEQKSEIISSASKTTTTALMADTCTAIDDDGVMTVASVYLTLNVKIETTTAGETDVMEWDSSRPDEGDPNMAGIYKELLNGRYSARYTAEGELLEVSGYDEMIERVAAGPGGPEMADYLRGSMSNDAMMETMSQASAFYPGKPVGVGDTWDADTSVSTPIVRLVGKYTYKLEKLERTDNGNIAHCTAVGSVKEAERDPDAEPNMFEEMGMKVTDSKQEIELSFNVTQGYAERTKLTQSMTMKMDLPGLDMEMVIESEVTTETTLVPESEVPEKLRIKPRDE